MTFSTSPLWAPILLVLALTFSGGCSKKAKANRHVQAANGYFAQDQYDKAEIEYLNVLRLDATNLTAIRNLGAIFYADEQMMRSLAFLNKAKKLDPGDLDSRGKLATLYFAAGATKEAREEATFVLQSSPTNENALFVLVDEAAKPEDFSALRQRLGGLRQKAGEHALFHVANGYISLKEGDQATAEKEFKSALSIEPRSALPHWALGNLYLSQTNTALAEPALKAAAELSPVRSSRRLKLVSLKLQAGEVAAAKSMLAEITGKAPDYLPAWIYSARVSMAEGNIQKGRADLNRVLTRMPDNFDALSLRAELSLAEGKVDKALGELDTLIARFPNSVAVRYQHAVASLLNKDTTKALTSLSSALAIDPAFGPAILLQSELNARKGNTAPAIASLTAYLGRRPQDEKAQMILASTYQSAGRPADAIVIYNKMLQRDPENRQVPLLLGLAYRQQGNEAEARKVFQRAVQARPDDVAAIAQLVDLDIASKKVEGTVALVQRWIDRAPKEAEPLFQMAKIRVAQNDLKAAEALLSKVIELNPDAVPAYYMLARLYYSSGQMDSALQKCELAYAKNPKDTSTLLLSGMIHAERNDFPKARDAYEKILVAAPNSIVALNNLAALYADRFGQLDKAYALARKAEELRPTDPHIADTFGWILARRGEFGLALGLLKESAQKRPADAEINAHLGLTYYLMGDESSARPALEQSLKMAPTFFDRAEVEQALTLLNLTPAAIDAKSIALLEKRLELRPADPVALRRVADAYQRAGQGDRVIAAYEHALNANPKMVGTMAKLAELYAAETITQSKALELVKTARKLSPEDPQIAHAAGRVALNSTDLKEQQWALSLLLESNQKQAGDAGVLYDLALAYYSQGRLVDAEKTMRSAVSTGQNSVIQPLANRFLEFLPLGSDPSRAAQGQGKADEALKADPNYVPALLTRALAAESNNPLAAIKAYEQVLARYPGFVPAIRSLALISAAQPGDNTKALNLLTKAREANPNDLDVVKALGSVLYQRGDYTKAVRHLSDTAKKLPNDAIVHYMLGMTHFQLKQVQESKTALRKALALQPNGAFAADAKRLLTELK